MNTNVFCTNRQSISKHQQQELYNFLSIGCGDRCRELSKQLNIALQKEKQLKITRRRVIKIMKNIGLSKEFGKKISLLLSRSNLSLREQRMVALQLKRLLLNFKRDLHSNLILGRINLDRLPANIRNFIIALIVLKAEIANLFRLEQQRKHLLCKARPDLSKNDRDLTLSKVDLNIDNHKSCRLGVALSKGNYAGLRDFSDEGNGRNYHQNRNINFDFNTTKQTRNKADEQQKNKKKYQNREQGIENNYFFNKNDFYPKQTNAQQQM